MSLENVTMDEMTATAPARLPVQNTAPVSLDEDIPPFDDVREFRSRPSLLRRVVEKVRLLPMVIFFSTLMLTVRVGDIWDGFEENVTVSSSEALAQAVDGPTPGEAAMPDGGELGGGLEMGDGADVMMAEEDQAAIAARMLADDPTLLTQSEIDLLQKLAVRRVEIDARAKELESRVILLAAAEARIDIKIEEFKALQSTIEALVKEYDQQQSTKLLSLVKIYENMKPKDAARILEELEMKTLLPVVEGMKDRSLAAVLAKMNSQRARDITVELNQLRKLPLPTGVGG
ncbi:MAG: hypothetical protein COB59_05370 [Rhodospirillaceae bacterium]|nr:MAG: hypothetical protein COB59_05370 [Rhodospirillaceae bacterium]